MISKSLRQLLARVGFLNQLMVSTLLGGIVAICVPAIAYLLGGVMKTLLGQQMGSEIEPQRNLVNGLVGVSTEMLSIQMLPPIGQVLVLLAATLLLVLLAAFMLYNFYRLIHIASVEFEATLISQLREHSKQLATVRTLSAQQVALTDCLSYHVPRIRASLVRWWRAFPRHCIQLAACILLALLLQPVLCLITLIATAIVLLTYRAVDRYRRTRLPVVRERASQEREALVALSLNGPLLESVHADQEIDHRFHDQLQHYRRDAVRSLTSSTWKTPTLLLVCGIFGVLFLFVTSVQILRNDTAFNVPEAFAFSLCCVGAAVSLGRLQRAFREIQSVEPAGEEVQAFLALQVEQFDSDSLQPIQRVYESAELDHATVIDCNGRKLLENVSVTFRPGMLVGVVASQRLQAQALVELLMGLGRPFSGRMLVDGRLVSDLQPGSLLKCSHWVAADGALVAGSVRDNILREHTQMAGPDLSEAVTKARLTEILQQLPDGLSTLISPNDDRLTSDAAFRLGIARSSLTDASIIVLEEPTAHYDQNIEQQTLDAIRSLVSERAITAVLPQRLITLRQCDLIVMLHDHKVADVGSHTDLLQRNDLYRHLNYLRFNPFRGIGA